MAKNANFAVSGSNEAAVNQVIMKSLLLFGTLGTAEIIIIAIVILLLFGGKKIPELMKGVGKGVRSFKEGMNDIEKDINSFDKPLDGGKEDGKQD